MKKERILIAQDNDLLQEICSDLKQFTPLLNNVKKAYESLEIGEFSQSIFSEMVFVGTNKIAQRFISSIEIDIEKTGVSNSIVKENIKNGLDAVLNEFLNCVKVLKKFRPETYSRQKSLTFDNISFSQKGFSISHDNRENILESQCRIYLETEEEHVVYEDLKNFIAAFEVVEKYITGTGITVNPIASKASYIELNFLTTKDGKLSVKPDIIKWIVNRRSMITNNK